MAKFDLDLKKFKHVKSDDKSTTLAHKDGHTLTIAHKSLSPEFQKQLSALSQASKDAETADQAQEAKIKQMCSGGKVKMAAGGVTPPDENAEINSGNGSIPSSPQPKDQSSSGGAGGIMKLLPLLAASKGGEINPKLEQSKKMPPKAHFKDGGQTNIEVPLQSKAFAIGLPIEAGSSTINKIYESWQLNHPEAHEHLQIQAQQQQEATQQRLQQQQQAMLQQQQETQNAQNFNKRFNNPQEQQSFNASLANQANYAQQQKSRDNQNQADEQAYQNKQNALEEPIDESGYKNYDAGGGVQADPQQVRSENPNFIPPQKVMQEAKNDPSPISPEGELVKRQIGMIQMSDPFASPEDAVEAALSNKKMRENSQHNAELDQSRQNARDANLNAQLQQLGLAPMLTDKSPVPNQQPDVPISQTVSPDATGTPMTDDSSPARAMQSLSQPVGTDQESMLQSAYANQMAAAKGLGGAQGALATQESQLLDQQAKAQQDTISAFQNHYNELEQERLDHTHDIQQGYIDPEQYWKEHKDPVTGETVGGHSKIASAIGMILAGFNPTNSPNAATEFIKYNIDKNIDAQKANLSAKNNLLAANLQQFGNLRNATDMTRVLMSDMVINQLKAAAAKASAPGANGSKGMAALAAQDAIGKLQASYAPQFMQLAMRRTLTSLANGDQNPAAVEKMFNYMDAYNPGSAKEYRERYVKGVGMSSNVVPQPVRDKINASQNVSRMLNELQNFNNTHPGAALNPRDRASAQTLLNSLTDSIRQAADQGVYKPSEASFLNSTIGQSPASFFHYFNSDPKIKELMQLKQAEYQNLLKNAGFNVQQPQQAMQPQFKTDKNGVKWMRGPNGQGIRVK